MRDARGSDDKEASTVQDWVRSEEGEVGRQLSKSLKVGYVEERDCSSQVM